MSETKRQGSDVVRQSLLKSDLKGSQYNSGQGASGCSLELREAYPS